MTIRNASLDPPIAELLLHRWDLLTTIAPARKDRRAEIHSAPDNEVCATVPVLPAAHSRDTSGT